MSRLLLKSATRKKIPKSHLVELVLISTVYVDDVIGVVDPKSATEKTQVVVIEFDLFTSLDGVRLPI